MTNISLLSEPSLHRTWTVKVLTKNLKHCSITAVDTSNKVQLFKEIVDVVIVDLETTDNHSDLIDFYIAQNKKVIVTSDMTNPELLDCFGKRLHGYFYKLMNNTEQLEAISMILEGKRYIHPLLSSVLLDGYIDLKSNKGTRPKNLLTKQEWLVLELLAKGHNNQDIGDQLHISERTAKNHVYSILKKLKVTNRTSAALLSIKNRWVNI
ncbi:response regulator transcription factor [Bacillus carboniphilus]|uniref:Response regulator transcription factor n=1 Tax=Bacillus carboniphilus TaxID=86663 RepID=A0ABN0VUE1_9BACI